MTAQEDLARRIERDTVCRAVQKKIDEGKADFTDTARYTDRAAELLGMVLADYVPDMPPDERETLCKALLRQRYLDTNAMLNAVQRTLDAAQGLHLAPQIADYPEERVDQAAHSLADETVPVETIVRRAKSAPATIARSFHDDYIEKNAAFRSSAGLKCYITRNAAAKCCEWCTKMAGRYSYGEEPEDVYRRHDNCSCSVTYENGRKRQDVWSKRTWEVPGKDAGASKPAVFSQEQAQTLQDEKGLTKPAGSGKMKLADSDDSWHPITEASIQAIPSISAFPEKVNSAIEQHCRELLSSLIDDKMGTEGTVSICLRDLTSKSAKGEQGVGTVSPIKLDEPFISIHNHPSNKSFSELDLSHFVTTENMAGMCVVGNSGENVYILKKAEGFNWLEFWNKVLPIQKSADFVKLVLKEAKKYGFEYYEIANR